MLYEASIGSDQRSFLVGLQHLWKSCVAPTSEKPSWPGITKSTADNIHKEWPNTFCRLVVLCRGLQFNLKFCFMSKRERERGGLFGGSRTELSLFSALLNITVKYIIWSLLCSQHVLHPIVVLDDPFICRHICGLCAKSLPLRLPSLPGPHAIPRFKLGFISRTVSPT